MRYYISGTPSYISNIGSFFDDFFADTATRKYPPVDIYETDKMYVIEAEVAGYGDDDIKVYVKDGTLTISSTETLKDKLLRKRNEKNLIASEISTPQFSRSFSLPEDASRDGIEAETRNGILTVMIPRIVKTEPGKIEIKIAR